MDRITTNEHHVFLIAILCRALTGCDSHRKLTNVHGLLQGLKLLVTHLIQYKYGSMEVLRESLVRSQVQLMQNEKTDTFESLCPAVHGTKRLKIHDNLTTKQTRFRLTIDKPRF